MEKLDSVVVILAQKMKDNVSLMQNVKLDLVVDLVWLHLALIMELIVVIHARVIVNFLKIKEMTFARMKTTIVDVNGMEGTVVELKLTHIIVLIVNV